MVLSKTILKSSNKFLQHKPQNVPEFVPLKCTVTYSCTAHDAQNGARRSSLIGIAYEYGSLLNLVQRYGRIKFRTVGIRTSFEGGGSIK